MLINKYKKQNGQALPIGMALFLVLGLMSFVLFNTGQTVSDKSRLVNTADSAVYSGLLWQARAMNFQAYTNRAMVANQVAMAQAVSINSWAAYIRKSGEKLNLAFGWVPYVGAVTRIIERIGVGIDTVLKPISQGMLSVVNAVNTSLSIAQKAMYYSSFVATPDVINSVVKSNEPDGQDFKWATAFSLVNAGLNLHAWSEFTENSDANKALAENERFHMINASMDKFSRERNWKFFNFFIPITPLNWVRFEKAGTTELIHKNGKYEMHAKDALSLREKRYTWRGKKYKDLPISGGSSFANTDNSNRSIRRDYLFFGGRHATAQTRPSRNSPLAIHEGRDMRNYSGIQAYRSLSTEVRNGDKPNTLKLRLQISMKTKAMMDSHESSDPNVAKGEFDFATSVETSGGVLSSVSTAELYFEKPCFEKDCIVEYANGYSPYWDVRLIETTGLSRLAAHTLQPGVLGDTKLNKTASLSQLPSYSRKLANPITDYKEQAKGVSVLIGGMENHLTSLVVDSPEYQQYKARLDGIKDNVTSELNSLSTQFIEENLGKEQLIDRIAKAAGVDLDVNEFKTIQQRIEEEYPTLAAVKNMSINDIKNQLEPQVDDLVAELKEEVRDELTNILRDAVDNIMAGMVSSFVEQATGIRVPTGIVEAASEQAADRLLSEAENVAGKQDADDIPIDLSNECNIYSTVRDAEMEVADMQARLEKINQEIADKFHIELKIESDAAIAKRQAYSDQIAVYREKIIAMNDSSRNERDKEDAIRDWNTQITNISSARAKVAEERVDALTIKLMTISDTATVSEFPDYKLEFRFAKRAVEETLGDINSFKVDENGDPVTDNLLPDDPNSPEEEQESDRDQTPTEKPEGCP